MGRRVTGGWEDEIRIDGFSRDCFAQRKRISSLIARTRVEAWAAVDTNEKCMDTENHENMESVPHGQAPWPVMGIPRRVHVKGMQGVDATVVVTVVRDTVWLSISPAFTWEAIMEPGKVDEVISMLERARDEAKKVATRRLSGRSPRNDSVAR